MDEEKKKKENKSPEEKLCEIIDAQAQKKIKSKNEGSEVLFGLGLFGIIGWSITIPTIAGIALGVFLDKRFQAGISWTLTLLFVGIVIGCLNAWHWIKEKSRED
ncbi:AtpZ/AtpI family protein [Clostridia bacterium]|nr:AtpZ/AtpI family protein [Clostridia bacterium]